jgi:ParB/RepB/Spo0J family partition protein
VSANTRTVAKATHQFIPLKSIDVSKTNPRTHFDDTKLRELAASIREHGVIQPVLVRPKGKRFELVAGERRFRASKLAKADTIPAVVRTLDDKHVLEIQVVENLQREDLHPLEEAAGYALLMKKHGYDANSVAAKIGRSRGYVYGRIKLSELCDAAKKALWDDVIPHSVALLIARIADKDLQTTATRRIVGKGPDTFSAEPMSYRAAFEYIHREFMLSLGAAPWKMNDATLIPKAGPCTTCPFRTGNQKELFGDVKSADVCTKPSCFKAKQDAHWTRVQTSAKDRGIRILPDSEITKVFGRYGGHNDHLDYSAPYVRLDDPIDYGSKKTFRAALGSKAPRITIARNPATNNVVELAPKDETISILKAAGIIKETSSRYGGAANRDGEKAAARARRLERDIENAVIAELRPKLVTLKTMSIDLLRIFTKSVAFGNVYRMEEVLKRRGIAMPGYNERPRAIVKFVDGLAEGEMVLVAAELLLNFSNLEARSGEEKTLVRQLARLVGIDDNGIEKRMRAEAAEKNRAKAAKERKKKAGKRKPAAIADDVPAEASL